MSKIIFPIGAFIICVFSLGCESKNKVSLESNENLLGVEMLNQNWNTFSTYFNKVVPFPENVSSVKSNIPNSDNWGDDLQKLSKTPEWKALVLEVENNDKSYQELHDLYVKSSASFSDYQLESVHVIPIILFQSRGGNIDSLFSEFYGTKMREDGLSKLLMDPKFNLNETSEKITVSDQSLIDDWCKEAERNGYIENIK